MILQTRGGQVKVLDCRVLFFSTHSIWFGLVDSIPWGSGGSSPGSLDLSLVCLSRSELVFFCIFYWVLREDYSIMCCKFLGGQVLGNGRRESWGRVLVYLVCLWVVVGGFYRLFGNNGLEVGFDTNCGG